MPRRTLHEPWRSFFEALDQELSAPCDLHCFGGFVLTEHYGVTRSTVRPTAGRPDREDLTLALWIEIILEVSGPPQTP